MHGSLLEARQRRPRAGATWVHAELGFSSASRLALALLLGGLAWQAFHFDPARSATGFVSHTLCSGAFVSGLNPGGAYADTLKPMTGIEKIGSALRYEVDTIRREVTATIFGLFKSVAIYREGLGCIVLPGDEGTRESLAASAGVMQQTAAPVLEEIAGPSVTEPA